jgi:hypothetical protein
MGCCVCYDNSSEINLTQVDRVKPTAGAFGSFETHLTVKEANDPMQTSMQTRDKLPHLNAPTYTHKHSDNAPHKSKQRSSKEQNTPLEAIDKNSSSSSVFERDPDFKFEEMSWSGSDRT